MELLKAFFLLCAGHALADYPLQSDFVALQKNPWLERAPGSPLYWPWVLSAHALIHGGAVTLVTGSLLLGLLEAACHWLIDLAKCAGLTGLHQDQALHLACKAAWVLLSVLGCR